MFFLEVTMSDFFQTLLISLIPAVISFMAAIIVEHMQIRSLKDQNRHDIDKLIKQHEIDIDNLKEKHVLEMDAKEKEFEHQLELIQKEFDNKLLLAQKEIESAQTVEGIKGIFGMIGSTLATPEGQRIIRDSINTTQDK